VVSHVHEMPRLDLGMTLGGVTDGIRAVSQMKSFVKTQHTV
jgi:hypothetical protein